MQYDAGLPPDSYVEGLKKLVRHLSELRRGASLWVRVEAPGNWYVREVRRALREEDLAIAVTKSGIEQPKFEDFSIPPYTIRVPSPPPQPQEDWDLRGLAGDELKCLRVLDRLREGYTHEIAALFGCGIDYVRKLLHILQQKKCAVYVTDGVRSVKQKGPTRIGDKVVGPVKAGEKRIYQFWRITKRGTTIALRSWGIPPNTYFPERREFRAPVDNRHRRAARRWPAWLKKAWPHAEVWTGWSEVKVNRLRATPDGLAWGRLDASETLFWLEVESGHSSSRKIQANIARRLDLAVAYSETLGVRLVFVLLGMPWVQNAARSSLAGISATTAVVTGDWNRFGRLPVVEWGKIRLATDV